jgi:tetratricopeptide (TPR) repeat protein
MHPGTNPVRNIRHIAARAVLIVAVCVAFVPATATAAGSEQSDDTAAARKPAVFQKGVELAKQGKFEEARKTFERADSQKRNDPEILNMLAYTQRKTGDLDTAIKNYQKALRLKPDFPEAREYLGEAHLQAALEQLDWLSKAGNGAKEQHQQLLKSIQDSAKGRGAAPARKKGW